MRQEYLIEIMALLEVYYPNHFKDMTDSSLRATISAWLQKFDGVDENTFKQAIERVVNKSRFFPMIADIVEEITYIETPELLNTAEEQWEIVIQAVRQFGLNEPHKAYDTLTPLTLSIVKEIEYRKICLSEKIGIERKQFIDLYNSQLNTYKQLKLLGNAITPLEQVKLEELGNKITGSRLKLVETKGGIKKIEIKN